MGAIERTTKATDSFLPNTHTNDDGSVCKNCKQLFSPLARNIDYIMEECTYVWTWVFFVMRFNHFLALKCHNIKFYQWT